MLWGVWGGVTPTPRGAAHHASRLHRLRDGAGVGLAPEGRALEVLSRVHDERKGVRVPAHPEEGHVAHLALPDVGPLFLLQGQDGLSHRTPNPQGTLQTWAPPSQISSSPWGLGRCGPGPPRGAASSYPGCLHPSAASPLGPPFPPWSHLCGVHPHGRVGHADEGGRPALPPRASGQLLNGLIQHVHPWQERSPAAAPCPSEVAAGAGCPAGSSPPMWDLLGLPTNVDISLASLSCRRASSTYPWPWVRAGCRCTVLRTSGSTASQHPGYPLPRKEGWMGSLPPQKTPRVHPKAHRDASSQATTFCLLGTPWPC